MIKRTLSLEVLFLALSLVLLLSSCSTPPNSSTAPSGSMSAPAATTSFSDLPGSHLLDQFAEQQRWKNISAQWGQSPFLPDAYKPQLTEEQKRQKIVDFYAFLNLRDRTFQGIASIQEKSSYYQTYIELLEQRISILNSLMPTWGRNSPAQQRYETLVHQKKLTEMLLAKYQELSDENATTLIDSAQRPRVVCFVDSFRIVDCEKESELIASLVNGHWTPSQEWITDVWHLSEAYEALIRIDELGIGLIDDFLTNGNTLAGCANGGWMVIDTLGPSSMAAYNIPMTNLDLPSIFEIEGLKAGCDVPLNANTSSVSSNVGSVESKIVGSVSGADNGSIPEMCEGARQMIARIDQTVNICNSSSGIAYGTMDSLVGNSMMVSGGDVRAFVIRVLAGLTIEAGKAAWNSEWGQYVREVIATEKDAQVSEMEAGALKGEADRKEVEALQAEAELNGANENLQKVANDPESTEEQLKDAQDAQKKASDNADKKRNEANEAKKKADDAKKKAEEEREKANEAKKKAKSSSSTSSNPGGPDGMLATCADLKSFWDNFKSQCSQTQSWGREATACNDFVRKSCGCVDVREIYPVPDDTSMSCRLLSVDEKKLRQEYCESLPYISVFEDRIYPDCNNVQMQPAPFMFDPTNICIDPATRPLDDQCLDYSITLPFPNIGAVGNPPIPIPNVVQVGSRLIVGSWLPDEPE